MVRLFSTNSETATPALFFAPAIFLILLVTTAVVSVGALGTYASFPRPSKSSTVNANLGLLLDWVEKTGRPTVMRAVVARAFGLDDRDFPVKERGFHESGEEFTHVFSVASSPGQEGGVFLALVNESDGQATVWRMSQSGILLATVIFADGVAQAVPNSRFESEFAAEFRYFLRKAQLGVSHAKSGKVAPGAQGNGRSQPPAVPNRSNWS